MFLYFLNRIETFNCNWPNLLINFLEMKFEFYSFHLIERKKLSSQIKSLRFWKKGGGNYLKINK